MDEKMNTKQITERRPTERQIAALRNFKVPEETIQGLTFDEASKLLDKYIGAIRGKEKKNPDDKKPDSTDTNPKPEIEKDEALAEGFDPADEAQEIMENAGNRVMSYFGISEKAQLSEAHINLMQEVQREIYVLRHWANGKEAF
jgi:hypothetical protein